jgi:polyhydroxybutyrate depolymerase
VLADLRGLLAVDDRRVFMSGMSNGGGMTNRAACEMADELAAVGIVAGLNLDAPGGCHPSRPVPVIAFNGTDDPLVHYDGGRLHALGRSATAGDSETAYPGAEAWAVQWSLRNGCTTEPQRDELAEDVTVTRYVGYRDRADVILNTVHGGGHTWPAGPGLPFLGRTTHSLSASQRMLDFFTTHPMPMEE